MISIRPLTHADLEIFKTIRLCALKNNPGVFSHPYERAIKQKPAYWEDILSRAGKEVFGLFDDDALIGITGVFTVQEDPSGKTAILGMSYIEPDYRGRGLSDMLYKTRINWAKEQGTFDKILVSHRAGNEASRRYL